MGGGQGSPVRSNPIFWKKFGSRFRSGQCNFALCGLVNAYISVWSVWPMPILRSVRSGQYPCFSQFSLDNTHISVCRVWSIPTFDRYVLLTTKQSKGESIKHFFGKLNELSENCDLGNDGDTLIRDLFIANMQNKRFKIVKRS